MNKLNYNKLIKIFNTESNHFYITIVNQYNYCVYQYKIDKINKTFKRGLYVFNENITTRPALKDFINFLKLIDYKEI